MLDSSELHVPAEQQIDDAQQKRQEQNEDRVGVEERQLGAELAERDRRVLEHDDQRLGKQFGQHGEHRLQRVDLERRVDVQVVLVQPIAFVAFERDGRLEVLEEEAPDTDEHAGLLASLIFTQCVTNFGLLRQQQVVVLVSPDGKKQQGEDEVLQLHESVDVVEAEHDRHDDSSVDQPLRPIDRLDSREKTVYFGDHFLQIIDGTV